MQGILLYTIILQGHARHNIDYHSARTCIMVFGTFFAGSKTVRNPIEHNNDEQAT